MSMRLMLRLPGNRTRLVTLIALIGVALTVVSITKVSAPSPPSPDEVWPPHFSLDVSRVDVIGEISASYNVDGDVFVVNLRLCDQDVAGLGVAMFVHTPHDQKTRSAENATIEVQRAGDPLTSRQQLETSWEPLGLASRPYGEGQLSAVLPGDLRANATGCFEVYFTFPEVNLARRSGPYTLVRMPSVGQCSTSEVEVDLDEDWRWWSVECDESVPEHFGDSISSIYVRLAPDVRINWTDADVESYPLASALHAPVGGQIILENAKELRSLGASQTRWGIVLGIGVSLVVEALVGLLTRLLKADG